MGGVDRQCKIVLIGDGSVGKSSLIARFRTEGFAPHYAQTIGVDFFEKRLELRGSQAVKLQIWDIGGQSIHSKMLPKYLYKAAVVLIVYDLTNSESLLNVDDWLAALRKVFVDKYTGEKLRMPHTYVVGNKADLLQHRQVTDSDHVRFWQERRLEGGFLTSARSGENVAKAVYATAAHAVGVDLTAYELAFHDRVLNKVDVASAGDAAAGGRTADADRIEEEDRLAELRKRQRASCSCALSDICKFAVSDGAAPPSFSIRAPSEDENAFSEITTLSNGVTSAVAADLGGDGDVEVVVASSTDGKIADYYYDDGEFTWNNAILHQVDDSEPTSVFAGDVDGDGDVDVIAALYGAQQVVLYDNDSTGTVARRADLRRRRRRRLPHGRARPGAPGAGDDDNACADAGPIRAILADVGDDEALDVLVAFADDQSIGYYYANDADQIVEFATMQASNTYDDPVYVVALDVDGDGALDVACSYPDIGTIYWFLWKNGAWTDYAVDQDAGDPTTLDAADIDGDNDVDLLASNDVVVAYGNVLHEGDDAAFEAAFEVMWEANAITGDIDGGGGTERTARDVAGGDIDGDGDVDAVAIYSNGYVAAYVLVCAGGNPSPTASPSAAPNAAIAWRDDTGNSCSSPDISAVWCRDNGDELFEQTDGAWRSACEAGCQTCLGYCGGSDPAPSAAPSPAPSAKPTAPPSQSRRRRRPAPSPAPSPGPSAAPSPGPSSAPSAAPSPGPSPAPSAPPAPAPSPAPSSAAPSAAVDRAVGPAVAGAVAAAVARAVLGVYAAWVLAVVVLVRLYKRRKRRGEPLLEPNLAEGHAVLFRVMAPLAVLDMELLPLFPRHAGKRSADGFPTVRISRAALAATLARDGLGARSR
ncbi:GTPase [Aureococcus anophagefferens]|nr:GTPase [Aureococcus anophagefferens]